MNFCGSFEISKMLEWPSGEGSPLVSIPIYQSSRAKLQLQPKNTWYTSVMKKDVFGGELLQNKRKSKRPLDFKKSTHLILRLRDHLPKFFSPRDPVLRKGFQKVAEKYGITVYDLVFNHTHLHASLKIPDRKAYVSFIREWTSKLVRYLSKTIGINVRKIFNFRPYTRIICWGRDYSGLKKYMRKNELESGILQLELWAPKAKKADSTPRSRKKIKSDSTPRSRKKTKS